ncbi:MAG: sulfatase [Armatimonadota bacterium]
MNVLFIAVDDLRVELGCYGDTAALTPHMDRLAEQGMVLNRAYCQEAVCNPSRASLMTGRRPDTIGVWDLRTHFRKRMPDVVTLPQHFKQHGYHAQSIGKIYHGKQAMQDAASWSAPATYEVLSKRDQYVLDINRTQKAGKKMAAVENADVPDDAYVDGMVADAAIDALRQLKDRPFFLAVGIRKPHLPFSAPKRYWDLYDRAKLPPPPNPEKPEGAPELALHNWVELRGYTDIPDVGPLSPEQAMELRHGYYAATSYADAQIGKVVAELERLGLDRNTVVILWGDHGFHLGEHDLWCKTTNFELDTRVPLILSVPGMPRPGVTADALVEFVDIYPTLVELCDLPVPDGLEGTSMAPVLEDPDRPWKRAAFSQFPRPWPSRDEPRVMGYSVRTAGHRYTEWLGRETGELQARELYDHASDPLETTNLADDPACESQRRRLEQMLKDGWQAALPQGRRSR